jgi:hypothetical protein
MDASNDPSESDSKELAPRKRSRWSISLSGVLIFAAGMMVGFAPMRAWLFFRDDPTYVVVEAILFEMSAKDAEAFRDAFDAWKSDDTSRNLDPVMLLRGRDRASVISEPTIMAMVGETATFQVGGEVFVPTADGSGIEPRSFGVEASFTPTVRASGKLGLKYRIAHASIENDAAGNPLARREVAIESSIVAEAGVWELVDLKSPTPDDVRHGDVRGLLLRVQPYEP